MYLFAVKIIEKNKLKSINIKVKRIRKEIELLQQLDSPYIINYINFCENNEKIFIITEYCKGGELLN